MMRGPLVPAKGLVHIVDLGGMRSFIAIYTNVRYADEPALCSRGYC